MKKDHEDAGGLSGDLRTHNRKISNSHHIVRDRVHILWGSSLPDAVPMNVLLNGVAHIDAEIRRLEWARALLTGHTAPLKRGRKRREVSPGGRARMAAAQKKRWRVKSVLRGGIENRTSQSPPQLIDPWNSLKTPLPAAQGLPFVFVQPVGHMLF